MSKKVIIILAGGLIVISVFSTFWILRGHPRKIPAATRPANWFSGDIHVHRNCGEGTLFISADSLQKMMETNDLDIISLLADMGNGEVQDSKTDLPNVNGHDAPQTTSGRIVHWDAEWHWDATYSAFDHQALGGHLVLLGLNHAQQIWEESPYKILDWARQQGAVSGFAHLQYLADTIQKQLNCCIPVDLPVEAALGTIDFVSEDVYSIQTTKGSYSSEAAMEAYYKLLNCGFRLGLAAGTDFPCNYNEPLGTMLTYARVDKELTYKKWITAIQTGHTIVSRTGNKEFLDLVVDGKSGPGDDITITQPTKLPVEITWSSGDEISGSIELIQNGKVVARKSGTSKPGSPLILSTDLSLSGSSWIAARRMNSREHVTHTAPVYVKKEGRPVRAGKQNALYYIQWIDNLLQKIEPGGAWHHYFIKDYETVKERYLKAREIFTTILNESE